MSGTGVSIVQHSNNFSQFGSKYNDYDYDEEESTPKETPTRGNFPQSTANWSNPLGSGFNPLNPLAANPLGGGPAPAVIRPPPKAEEQLVPIKDGFKNEYIKKMSQSKEMMEEYDKYDGKSIKMRNKSIEILETLNKDEIDIKRLQQIAFSGIPETIKGLRAVVWRIILGELTNKTGEWKSTLEQNFETYENFKKELIIKPKLKDEEEK